MIFWNSGSPCPTLWHQSYSLDCVSIARSQKPSFNLRWGALRRFFRKKLHFQVDLRRLFLDRCTKQPRDMIISSLLKMQLPPQRSLRIFPQSNLKIWFSPLIAVSSSIEIENVIFYSKAKNMNFSSNLPENTVSSEKIFLKNH